MTMRVAELRIWLLSGVLAAGGGVGAAHAQLVGARPSGATLPTGVNAGNDRDADHIPPEVRERMEKARQDDRMRRIQADTDKLLALATSLKQDVDKTDRYTLSLDVVRRADEIERLARSIRDREKQ